MTTVEDNSTRSVWYGCTVQEGMLVPDHSDSDEQWLQFGTDYVQGCLLSNQCSSCLLVYVKRRSYFPELEITRAAALRTFWNLSITNFTNPVLTSLDVHCTTTTVILYSKRTQPNRQFTCVMMKLNVPAGNSPWHRWRNEYHTPYLVIYDDVL